MKIAFCLPFFSCLSFFSLVPAHAEAEKSNPVPGVCRVEEAPASEKGTEKGHLLYLHGVLKIDSTTCPEESPKELPLQLPLAIAENGAAKVLMGGGKVALELTGRGSIADGVVVEGEKALPQGTIKIALTTGPLESGKNVRLRFEQSAEETKSKKVCSAVLVCS